MTPEEKTAVENRVAAYDAAQRRIAYLDQALDALNADSVASIVLDFPLGAGAAPVLSYQSRENGETLRRVCWAQQEPGLVAEVRRALVEIISRRMTEATQQAAEA